MELGGEPRFDWVTITPHQQTSSDSVGPWCPIIPQATAIRQTRHSSPVRAAAAHWDGTSITTADLDERGSNALTVHSLKGPGERR